MTLQELRALRAQKIDEARGILDAATDGVLADDQQQRWDALMGEADGLNATIERQERQEAADRELNTAAAPRSLEAGEVEERSATPAPEVKDEAGPHWRRRVVRYFNALAMKKENEEKALRMLGAVRQEARALPTAQVRDEQKEAEAIVTRSGLPAEKQASLRALLGVGEFRLLTSEAGDAQGADNLLPAPFLAEIFVLTEQYGVARQIFRTLPFSGPGNTMSLKNVVGRVIAYWVDQGELIPPSDMSFGADTLSLNKLAGITSWTTEMEEDTAFSLIPIIQQDFAEAIAYKEDLAGFLGDGTATYGGFTGILRNAGVTVRNSAGTDGAVTEAELRALKQSVSMSRRGSARWLMHESVMDQIRQLENTAGYRLFSENLTAEGATVLLGYPVTFAEVLPAASGVSGNSSPILAFGDFGRVLMGIKRGMTADVSREAILQNSSTGDVIYNAYQADGALLRVTERIGFAVPTSVDSAIAVLKTAAV